MKTKFFIIAAIALCSLCLLSGCVLLEGDETPTKSKMEGVWQVVEAYDESGNSIIKDIAFPVTAFHLSSDRTVLSTAGPMTMFIVYGNSNYVKVAAKIDQVFNYTNLDVNGGEFFIAGGQVDRFTLEMKLQGLPGQKALTDLLSLLSIGNDYLDAIVYHKFMDISVSFTDFNADTMVWEIDEQTSAVYNTKDNNGNYVSWGGWPATNFSKCRFVLAKRVKSLQEIIKEHSSSSPQKL